MTKSVCNHSMISWASILGRSLPCFLTGKSGKHKGLFTFWVFGNTWQAAFLASELQENGHCWRNDWWMFTATTLNAAIKEWNV